MVNVVDLILGKLAIQQQLLAEQALHQCLQAAQGSGRPLLQVLLDRGLHPERLKVLYQQAQSARLVCASCALRSGPAELMPHDPWSCRRCSGPLALLGPDEDSGRFAAPVAQQQSPQPQGEGGSNFGAGSHFGQPGSQFGPPGSQFGPGSGSHFPAQGSGSHWTGGSTPGSAHFRANDPNFQPFDATTGSRRFQAKDFSGSGSWRSNRIGPGMSLGDYDILEELGRGGMGVVLRAHQRTLRRDVALKVLLSGNKASERQVKRFTREAGALAKLAHPNVVRVYDTGEFGDHLYFTMELVEGQPLGELIDHKRLSLRRSVEVARDLARGLQHAHERGVIHRDVKPDNVLIDPSGTPLLTDFGLVRDTALDVSRLTRSGAVLGTPYYMSPEQARGQAHDITGAADVYSLGVVLYQMLTNELPFRAETQIQLCKMIIEKPAPRTSALNQATKGDLEAVVAKSLAKKPEDRYRTAADFADDLGRFLQGEPVAARGVGGRGLLIAQIVGALLLLVCVAALGAFVARRASKQIVKSTPTATQTPVDDAFARALSEVQRLRREVALLPPGDRYRQALGDQIKALTAALHLDDKRLDLLLERGRCCTALQRYDEAERDFAAIMKADGGEVGAEATFRLARAFSSADRFEDVEIGRRVQAWLEAHPTDDPGPWRRLTQLLRVYLGDKSVESLTKVSRGLVALTESGDKGSWLGACWSVRGAAAFGRGEQAEAFRALNRVVELEPRNAGAWASRASYQLLAKNDVTRALDDIDRALRLNPDQPLALEVRSNIRFRQDDLAGAAADMERALERSPKRAMIMLNLAAVYRRQRKTAEAEAMLTRAIQVAPHDPSVVHKVAETHLAESQPGKALEVLFEGMERAKHIQDRGRLRRRAEDLAVMAQLWVVTSAYAKKRLAKNPDDALGNALLGDVDFFKSTNRHEATDHWEAALRRRPSWLLVMRMIRARISELDDRGILKLNEQLIELGKDEPEALGFAARVYTQLKERDMDKALALAEETVKRFPTSGPARAALALIYGMSKRGAEALETLKLAEQLEPELVEIHLLRAQLLAQRGQLNDALSAVRWAWRINPYRTEVLDTYARLLGEAEKWDDILRLVGETQERWDGRKIPLRVHLVAIKALLVRKKLRQAQGILTDLLKQLPPAGVFSYRKRVLPLLLEAEMRPEALQVAKKLLEGAPEDPFLKDFLQRFGE